MDRQARRQLILTRTALERAELVIDLERVRRTVDVSQWFRAALRPSVLRNFFGDGDAGDQRWTRIALLLLRRYRLVGAAFGLLAPLLRGRSWLRSLLIASIVAAATWAAWQALRAADATVTNGPGRR